MTGTGAGRRAAALTELLVLDTPEEQAFDDLVFIAAQVCHAPIALISLLDTDRQWFKARVGLDATQTNLDQSVCKLEIDQADLLEVRDLTADDRTRTNPLVTGARAFRFYAGAPLVLRSGAVVGRLCVIDTVARPEGLDGTEKALLMALARQTSEHLELRRIAQASERLTGLQTALVQIGERIRDSVDAAAMALATTGIVGRVLAVDRVGFGSVDGAVDVIDVEPDWTAPGVASVAGRHRFADYGALREPLAAGQPLVIEDVLIDDRTSADAARLTGIGVRALVNMPVREGGRTTAVFLVHSASPRSWTKDEIIFLRSVADRLEAGVSRQHAEQQQHILNGEISHRLKNMLTMVQAIAGQTLRAAGDQAAVRSFEQRLTALGAAQDALLQQSWKEADFRAVASTVAETVGFADRMLLSGPVVALGPRAALSFSLIVHELLTNACKYGALSVEAGAVELRWIVERRDGDDQLVVEWRERGGPPVTSPSHRGFGSRLIRAGLVGTGDVDLRYEATGLEVDLQASVHHLTQA